MPFVCGRRPRRRADVCQLVVAGIRGPRARRLFRRPRGRRSPPARRSGGRARARRGAGDRVSTAPRARRRLSLALGRARSGARSRRRRDGWIGTATDIDDHKRAEDATRSWRRRDGSAREAAEAANRAKDEFLATLSHELRTPLNAILGWVAHAATRTQLDDARTQRALETIERNARAQAQLIEDLLDVSRIITGKLRARARAGRSRSRSSTPRRRRGRGRRPTPRAIAARRGIEPRCARRSLGDPTACSRSCGTSCPTPSSSRPPAAASRSRSSAATDARRASRSATPACGIAPEFLPFVFDRFRQADSGDDARARRARARARDRPHIVELHGGTVSRDSDGEGQGATFTRAAAAARRRAPSGRDGAPERRSGLRPATTSWST